MKGGGGAPLGYPLKQTMTMTSKEQTFTVTTEVMEMNNTSLEPALFDPPPGCQMMDMNAMMGAAPAAPARPTHPEPTPAPSATAAPSAQPAACGSSHSAQSCRRSACGVVKINDKSGQSLPTTIFG